MPILFCEKCGKETEWVYLGNIVACKSCGWQMSVQEFRAYRSRILREEFEKFLKEAKDRTFGDKLKSILGEVQRLFETNPKFREEVIEFQRRELEKAVREIQRSRSRRRRRAVMGVYPL